MSISTTRIWRWVLPCLLVLSTYGVYWLIVDQAARAFLNQNTGALTVVFTFAVAAATVAYVILTWSLVAETKRLREAQSRPQVSLRVQPREEWLNFIDLVIENTGSGPAQNIRFDLKRDFSFKEQHGLGDINIFRQGLRFLAPGQHLRTFFVSLVGELEEPPYPTAEVVITYNDTEGREFAQTFVLDTSEFLGFSQLGEPPIESIEKHLKRIADALAKPIDNAGRVRVATMTRQEVREEQDEQKRRYAELRANANLTKEEVGLDEAAGTSGGRL